jgi:small subunit ribosomal protein S4
VNIPSYLIKEGDVIEIKKKSKKLALMKEILKVSQKKVLPGWLEIDKKSLKGMVKRLPLSEELNQEIDLPLVVGYYSR